MNTYFLGLGGNLGRTASIFSLACKRLLERGCRIIDTSSLYRSPPLPSETEQEDYINAVIRIESSLQPRSLLLKIHEIEQGLGRSRANSVHWGPRPIDIDIIASEGLVFEDEILSIPHTEMHRRSFVLKPLAEISPHWRHPKLGRSLTQLLEGEVSAMPCEKIAPFPRYES